MVSETETVKKHRRRRKAKRTRSAAPVQTKAVSPSAGISFEPYVPPAAPKQLPATPGIVFEKYTPPPAPKPEGIVFEKYTPLEPVILTGRQVSHAQSSVQVIEKVTTETPPAANGKTMFWPFANNKPKTEVNPAPKPQPIPVKPSEETKVKKNYRKVLMIAGGIGTSVISFIPLMIYFTNPTQMVLGVVGLFGFIGGGIVSYLGFKKDDPGVMITKVDGKQVKINANSLVIADDKIQFVDSSLHPPWQRRKCRNDGKFYFVYIEETNPNSKLTLYEPITGNTKKFRQFVLPDTQYRDPREFANNLNIPAHRRLAQREASLLQKIAPFAIVAAIGIVVLLIIATSNPPAPPATTGTTIQGQVR